MPHILILILILFLILVGVQGLLIEPRTLKIEKIPLEIENLPAPFKGLKILHLSDLHSFGFGQKEKKVLESLEQLEPDFIFITGDIVDWRTRDFDSCQKFWQELSKNHQGRIFGVYGNHDHKNRKFKLLKDLLKESKIEILDNEARKIEKDEESIYLIGVDDPHLEYDDIEKAMEEVRGDSFKILLAHSPEIFRKVKGRDIALVLVGHTHGGQIDIPFLSNLILPLKYDKKYKEGLFKENSTYLYVNRGVGESFLPIRINSLPEVALIELK